MDLVAITPGEVDQSVDACLRWLANQSNGHWTLFFDNADDVNVNLSTFFPPCTAGNILVTTRNRELRHYATKGSDQNVTSMEHDDATNLLLHLSQAEETEGNKDLAAHIVQVFPAVWFWDNATKLTHDTGTSSLRFGSLPSWRIHLLPLVIEPLSKTLPT